MAHPKRAVPDDFRELVATTPLTQLKARYNCGQGTLYRWLHETGYDELAPFTSHAGVTPDDFIARAARSTRSELLTHYKIGTRTLERWLTNTGAKTRGQLAVEEARTRAPTPPKRPTPTTTPKPRTDMPEAPKVQDATPSPIVAGAAQFLRKHHSNVHRADIRMFEGRGDTWGDHYGAPDRGVGHYYVSGAGIVSHAQLVEMAEARGYRTGDVF